MWMLKTKKHWFIIVNGFISDKNYFLITFRPDSKVMNHCSNMAAANFLLIGVKKWHYFMSLKNIPVYSSVAFGDDANLETNSTHFATEVYSLKLGKAFIQETLLFKNHMCKAEYVKEW